MNALGPSHCDQLDVSMNISDREDATTTRFVVRVDGDAAVVVQLHRQPFECFLCREETDLNNCMAEKNRLAGV